jgi:hypothetical protein
MKKFKFTNEVVVEAESLDDAVIKFSQIAENFAPEAEKEFETITLERVMVMIPSFIEKLVYRNINGEEINSVIINQQDEEPSSENIIDKNVYYIGIKNKMMSEEDWDVLNEHIDFLLDNSSLTKKEIKEFMESIDTA